MMKSEVTLESSEEDAMPDTGNWRDAFTREEIDELLAFQDGRSWWTVAVNWGLVFASFALVAAWPNPLTIVVAIFVIGARQLGMAVLMHDASHRALFENRKLNDFVGQWLAAYPTWADCATYRPYHLQHHAPTGSERDPDLGLTKPFPITKQSLRRKIWRDLSGQTGIKFARASFKRSVGRWDTPDGRRAAIGFLVTNGVLLGILTIAGHPALYLLWAVAWLTTNTLVTRIRAIAEHALTDDPADPLRNTRTTLLSWWERLLVGPNRVNYHLEHHLLMTVPHYNLPKMHRMLEEKGQLAGACIEPGGYIPVLRNAASKPTPLPA
jgi:fatty acid desaturase